LSDKRHSGGEFFYVIDDRLTIIYADDDPILREFAQVHLASETVELLTVPDGRELITLLAATRPDIILLDLEMPNMDGFEVLNHLGADETLSRIPVIVVTGREDVAAIDRAYKAGATSFVVKPMNWRQLSYQIRYVHRTAGNEAHLLDLQRRAVRERTSAMGALNTVAREGSQFLSTALAKDPSLRPAAAQFAASLQFALEISSRPADRRAS
jgi:DNA-binding response OmpR family regulator